MALTKVTGKGLDNNVVDSTKLSTNSVTETKIATGAVTSAKISDGTVSADDLASSLDLSSKTVTLPTTSVTAAMLSNTLDLSSKTITLPQSATATLDQNIALLGFKMAITDGLTIFNLVDGVVDEFEDESGTCASASTNLTYNSADDYYVNSTSPTGVAFCSSVPYSAGFTTTSITEPDTSVTGTNPAFGSGTFADFTVPTAVTSLNAYVWGAGGKGSMGATDPAYGGGGGGFTSGTISVTPGQVLEVVVGEAGCGSGITGQALGGGGSNTPADNLGGGGAGLSGVFTNSEGFPALIDNSPKAPQVFLVAGGGGSYGHGNTINYAGAGGGLIGHAGGQTSAQNSARGPGGGGGSQTQGGQYDLIQTIPSPAAFLRGGSSSRGPQAHGGGGGGGGYYGGAGGSRGGPGNPAGGGGGGGSSYYGHPQITSGSTEDGSGATGGGIASPLYIPGTNEGGPGQPNPNPANDNGEDGYVLLQGTGTTPTPASVTSSTIISDPFTSTTVPTTSRIVVFEENVGTPTLNTDIIASISRNNGTNYTTATLTDSGYVTGSSGQRILTGTATISGQPSGQSMRWKLELANNTVKIHGVALQWK